MSHLRPSSVTEVLLQSVTVSWAIPDPRPSTEVLLEDIHGAFHSVVDLRSHLLKKKKKMKYEERTKKYQDTGNTDHVTQQCRYIYILKITQKNAQGCDVLSRFTRSPPSTFQERHVVCTTRVYALAARGWLAAPTTRKRHTKAEANTYTRTQTETDTQDRHTERQTRTLHTIDIF